MWYSILDKQPAFEDIIEALNADRLIERTDYHTVRSGTVLIQHKGKYYCGRFCKCSCSIQPNDIDYYWELATNDDTLLQMDVSETDKWMNIPRE